MPRLVHDPKIDREQPLEALRATAAAAPHAVRNKLYELRSFARFLATRWRALSLAQQFALAGSAVLLPGMAVIGFWVASQIRDGVTRNSGVSAALYMNSFVAPEIQELAERTRLSDRTIARLDDLMKDAVAHRIVSIKIWLLDGTIVYSTQKDRIGKKFALTPNFKLAAKGSLAAEFEGHYHEQDVHEQGMSMPLLEIYAPIRKQDSSSIIAVAEFYERGDALKADLWRATGLSWLVVGGVALVMMSALAGIVARGSRTIDEQRARLEHQVVELRGLLDTNASLSTALQRAYHRTADINEQFLRRVGADLHDGPAQLLSLAMLNIDALDPGHSAGNAAPDGSEVQRIRSALADAMKEIRTISAGLVLPQLGTATLEETIMIAIRAHIQRTGSRIRAGIAELPDDVPRSLKVCTFRFIQEALNNAFVHGGGKDQSVKAFERNGIIEIEVSDKGGGITSQPTAAAARKSGGLGLAGLRDRIETLGGELEIISTPGIGTTLKARFGLERVRMMEHSDDK